MTAGENGEAGSCSSGCDVIICKLGPLHPKPLSMLENTNYGNQFDERLNLFTGLVRTWNEKFWILTEIKLWWLQLLNPIAVLGKDWNVN
jgi:hypothetical protein